MTKLSQKQLYARVAEALYELSMVAANYHIAIESDDVGDITLCMKDSDQRVELQDSVVDDCVLDADSLHELAEAFRKKSE